MFVYLRGPRPTLGKEEIKGKLAQAKIFIVPPWAAAASEIRNRNQDSQTLVDELMAKTKIFFFLAALMIAEAWDVSLCTLSFELEFNGRLKLGVMTSVGQVAN